MRMMTFHLAGETYAVDLSFVASVVRGGETLDGAGRPLVELAALLGAAERPGVGAPILVLRGPEGREAGVRVERLGEVVEVDAAALSEVPRYFDAPLLQGVTCVGEALAVVLDGALLIKEAVSASAVRAEPNARQEGS